MKGVKQRRHNSINFAVSMTLFAVFALFLTLVLLTGASSFRNVAASSEARHNERVPLMYVSQRLRAFDRVDAFSGERAISVAQIDGVSAIVLTETQEFEKIAIYIYQHEGFLNEMYVFDDDKVDLNLGERLFAAESAHFAETRPGLIEITIDGNTTYVNLMSGVGV
jgi:hypothetical protein